jgi:undecaprenyl-phosphate galactose phosphotransferase/putative colanic acid biosynthesis UDP-glucose lipid carrier transferase
MSQRKSKYIPLLTSFVDVTLLLFSFLLAKCFVFNGPVPNAIFYNGLVLGWGILWVGICLKYNLYEYPRILYIHKVLSNNIYAIVIFTFLSGGLIFFATDYKFSRLFFGVSIISFTILILIWRILSIYSLKKYRQKGYNFRKIVLIGLNQNVITLIDSIYLNPNYGFQISGLFTNTEITDNYKKHYKGELSEIKQFLKKNTVDEIVISLPYHQSKLINELLHYADNNMIRTSVVPEFSEYLSQTFSIDYIKNIPILKMRKEPLESITNRILKRFFDVGFSMFLIIFVFSWLFPVLGLIIKLTSKGPVFFTQKRTGKNGHSFTCFKFRSMTVNKNSDRIQAIKGDSRITPFGSFMRKTSIDEFPQIFNVLLNHMSFVGPRPHMLKQTEEYRLLVDKFMVRHFA